MRKLLFLATVILAAFASSYADERVEIDGLFYNLRSASYSGEEGVLQCTLAAPVSSGFANGDEYKGEITVPPFITYSNQKYAVTAIDWYVFRDQSELTKVNLPETLVTIGNASFMRSGITSIEIPEAVKTIENNAFMNCSSLTTVISNNPTPPALASNTFPAAVTSKATLYVPKGFVNAYTNADYWKNFTSIEENPDSPVRPESLTLNRTSGIILVGNQMQLIPTVLPADATDKSIVWSVNNPEVAEVDENGVVTGKKQGQTVVFARCNAYSQAQTSCTILVQNATEEIDGINYRFVLDEDARIFDAYVVRGNSEYSGDVVIPATVNALTQFNVAGIDANAFALMRNVTSVTIPYSVKSMGQSAFRDCSGLKRVNISYLDNWANIDFSDARSTPLCNSEAELWLNGQPVTEINLNGKTENVKPFVFLGVNTLTSLTIGEGMKSLGDSSFKDCSALTSVSLPSSLEKIGLSVFSGCKSLEAVTLPEGLSDLGAGAFSNTGLKSMVVPSKISVIDNQTFMNCDKLESIELPESLEMIYLMVFDGCESLRNIVCPAVKTPSFFEAVGMALEPFPAVVYESAILSVPAESVEAYREAKYWKKFADIRAIVSEPEGVEAEIDGVTYSLFADKGTATVIADNREGEIIIPAMVEYEAAQYDVTAIGEGVYDGHENVTSIILPESITTIGRRAFAGTAVDVFAVPQSVTEIPAEMLADCQRLISLSLPDRLEKIGVRAFSNDERLRYIFSNNLGTGDDHIPPVFSTFEGDPTGYGEAFSPEIWPDCLLVIPANMFMNYKKLAGWKNFRSWAYWHDYDVLVSELTTDPTEVVGKIGDKMSLRPLIGPANATLLSLIITGFDSNIISIETDGDAYSITLLEEGTTRIDMYCGLVKWSCNVTVSKNGGVDKIDSEADTAVRYFNLQGNEIFNPAKGQILIEVSGGKSTKRIF